MHGRHRHRQRFVVGDGHSTCACTTSAILPAIFLEWERVNPEYDHHTPQLRVTAGQN